MSGGVADGGVVLKRNLIVRAERTNITDKRHFDLIWSDRQNTQSIVNPWLV